MISYLKHIKSYGFVIVFVCAIRVSAQVGVGTVNPDPSSVLDVSSSTGGFLMPRMTTIERNAIVNPTVGLEVYDTTSNSHWYFDGTIWVENTAGGDRTDDAWVNNLAGRLELGAQSDGTTARTEGTEFVVLDNGNVGIGTTEPTQRLEVAGNVKFTTSGSGINFILGDADDRLLLGNGSTSTFDAAGGALIQTAGNSFTPIGSLEAGDIVFTHGTPGGTSPSSVPGMHIKNTTGNVGIGTADPVEKLHVIGSFRLQNGSHAAGRILTSDANGTATWQAPTPVPLFGSDWINVIASRSLNTTYTNTSGRDLYVAVTLDHAVGGVSSAVSSMVVDGVAVQNFVPQSGWTELSFSMIVPAGSTYSVTISGVVPALVSWNER